MGCGSSKATDVVVPAQSDGEPATVTATVTANVTANKTASVTANKTASVTANETASVTANETASVTTNETASEQAKRGPGKGGGPLPPVCPPRHTKAQLIPDPAVFTQLDCFVSNTPNTVTDSLEELASYLTSRCSDDLQKIRALFCWLAYNIEYDTDSYFSGNYQPQDSNSVLQSRKAVCQGYSDLFLSLCKLANIPCILVQGIAKGYRHDPEDVYTASSKTNHAWNLVLVKGEWRPLDTTWGAGHLDMGGNFNRKFDEHWFLTDPEEFVPRHFPLVDRNIKESEKLQLLAKPWTIDRYSACVRFDTLAYDIGLRCITHDCTVIQVSHDVTIKLKATRHQLESVSATLMERGSQGATKDRSNVLTSLDDDGMCTIYVRPPGAATYILDVMGQAEGQDRSKLHPLLSYVIKCTAPESNPEPFPDKFGAWGLQKPMALQCGLLQAAKAKASDASDRSFSFKAKDSVVKVPVSLSRFADLKVQLKHARCMEEDMAQYTFIEYTEDGATVTVRLPKPGYYLLRLFASHPELSGLQQAADYLLFSDKQRPCEPFPRAYKLANQQRARLLQPLIGQVPSGESTLYRVHAPSLGKISVAGKMMEKKNDGVWEAEVTPQEGKSDVTVFGAVDKDSKSLQGLYQFTVAT